MKRDRIERKWRGDAPVPKCFQHLFEFSRLEIPSHGVLDFELLFLLIKFSTEDVEVDSIDDEVFEFSDCGHLQFLEEQRVG